MHSAPLKKRNDSANGLGCSKVGTGKIEQKSAETHVRGQKDAAERENWELSIVTVLWVVIGRAWR